MKSLKTIGAIILAVVFAVLMVDTIRFPECHFTTWKYQLENDIKQGNERAIEYYHERYIANGRYLFGEEDTRLDMATVVDYETTEYGLYLYTNDGNGYYLEIAK